MNSVLSKMLVSGILVLFITLGVTSGLLLSLTTDYISEREEIAALDSAEELGSLLRYRTRENAGVFNRLIASYANKLDATVFVCDTAGTVLISSGSINNRMSEFVPVGYKLSEEQYKSVIEGNTINSRGNFDDYFSKDVITAGVPLNIDGYIQGGVFVCRAVPAPGDLARELRGYFLLAVVISFSFASLIIYIFARRVTAPIAKMKKAARAFASGNFGERADVPGYGELTELANEFNNMADSLQNLENNRRAFVADISHELRTPMTTISGFVEGMLDGTIPESSRDKYLSVVLDETKRLTRLVNDILYAEKYRKGETVINKEVFDINEIVRLALIGQEFRISEKNIDAEAAFEYETMNVLADRDSITRVITNLVDNAVKFADNGGKIKITTENIGGKCNVSVFNSGSFISPEDKNKIFDRFYKTDRSRSMDKKGVGLGLHIVKSILAQHKSNISVESNSLGTTFFFTLDSAKTRQTDS